MIFWPRRSTTEWLSPREGFDWTAYGKKTRCLLRYNREAVVWPDEEGFAWRASGERILFSARDCWVTGLVAAWRPLDPKGVHFSQ